MLEPGHVVPANLGRLSGHRGRKRVEVGDASASGKPAEEDTQRERSSAAEQVRVVEVHVNEVGERAPRERTTEVAERVRRGQRRKGSSRREAYLRGTLERGPPLTCGQVGRTCRPGRAVDIVELRARLCHVLVRVPASPAEQRGREAEIPQALSFFPDTDTSDGAGRSRVIGSRPVRVVAEWRELRRLADPLEPNAGVLAGGRIGRADERSDPKTARRAPLQSRESRPHLVVERSFDVAGDDRVPFATHRAPTVPRPERSTRLRHGRHRSWAGCGLRRSGQVRP
jgi:hypothetical protein